MTRNIPDIIEEILSKMIVSLKWTLTSQSATHTTINTCNTFFAVVGGYLIVNGNEYLISSINDKDITFIGVPTLLPTDVITLKNPFFIHGTPRQANIELDIYSKNVSVTPLMYLFEPIRERFREELNPIQRDVELHIAFLHNYSNDHITNEIYVTSINAMRSLSELFIHTLKKQVNLLDRENVKYDLLSFAKYGQYTDKSGSQKNIFNFNLSGIDINLTIPLKDENICVNLC